MIKHQQKIIINSDIHKVWFFIIDLSRSLIFDKYYKKIELKSSYSINKNFNFLVHAKYFNKKSILSAKVINSIPPNQIKIQFQDKNNTIYSHTKLFKLSSIKNKTILKYENYGSFDNQFYDFFFYYLIKSSCLNEIRYIKKAIESSDSYYNHHKLKTAK